MKCPYCQNTETKVTDKRDAEDFNATRRRRECLKCSKRFTTYEKIETSNLVVVKKDGIKEQYSREKLKKGLKKACEKRPVSEEKIDSEIDAIEMQLIKNENGEISSKDIGELAIKALKKLDKVAYIRFASVYREFTDLQDFEEELKKLLKRQ